MDSLIHLKFLHDRLHLLVGLLFGFAYSIVPASFRNYAWHNLVMSIVFGQLLVHLRCRDDP